MKTTRAITLSSIIVLTLSLLMSTLQAYQATDTPIKEITRDDTAVSSDVFMINIHGPIHNVTSERVARQIEFAKAHGCKTLIINLDTPGGMVSSTFDICKAITKSNLKTIAWVNPHAFSAGSMISVTCDQIVISKGAQIGDCAPIITDKDGSLKQLQDTERAKVEAPILTHFRAMAVRNGYSELLSEAMVTLHEPICKIRNSQTEEVRYVLLEELPRYGIKVDEKGMPTINTNPTPPQTTPSPATNESPSNTTTKWDFIKIALKKNKLLTMSTAEAIEFGFAKAEINTVEELRKHLNTSATILHMKRTTSELFASWLTEPAVRGILVMIIMIGGYLEIQSPGLSFPGAAAAISLILMMGGPLMAGYAGITEIALVLIGFILIILEIFVIPGFGVAGIAGIIFVFLGMIFSFVPPDFDPSWLPQTSFAWDKLAEGLVTMAASMSLSIIVFFILARYFDIIPGFGRMILAGGEYAESPIPSGAEYKPGTINIGSTGIALTPLRPVGRAEIANQTMDVVTQGELIDEGTTLRVIEISGNRVVVEGT